MSVGATIFGNVLFSNSYSVLCASSCLDFHKNRNSKLVTITPAPSHEVGTGVLRGEIIRSR